MSTKQLRVGIIGADTSASCAGGSHIPAIQKHPSLVLAAVATRREESARAAAKAFGAERWYADPYELINDDTIDIVTVAVKVPAHKALVLAALKAKKAVYCESPLGSTLAETEQMAAEVGALHTAIGLQGRQNPAVRRAAELIASGKLGTLMSANVRATTFGYGPESPSVYDYFNKAASGASFLTITTAHVLDIIEAVLGNVTEVDARTELLWPEVKLTDTGATSVREIPDHVDIIAKTALGAPVSVQVLAGVPENEANFVMEIRGSKGSLKLRGNHMAGVQVGDLALSASVAFAPPETPIALGAVNASAPSVWAGAATNVGEVYGSLARDMAQGTFNTPDFAHAVHNSQLVAAVERAAQTGERQRNLG
jgi:predicted dehydrogenase